MMEVTRIDRWLTAVRVYKTRAGAAEACGGGRVRVNGVVAKAATPVRAGDRVLARFSGVERVLEVVRVIDKRVAASIAAGCLVDHTPVPKPGIGDGPVLVRDPSSGRPTKRDRRQLDRLRGS